MRWYLPMTCELARNPQPTSIRTYTHAYIYTYRHMGIRRTDGRTDRRTDGQTRIRTCVHTHRCVYLHMIMYKRQPPCWICTYPAQYVWMYACMHVWMYECMYLNIYMSMSLYVCMYVCMHVICMYVRIQKGKNMNRGMSGCKCKRLTRDLKLRNPKLTTEACECRGLNT